MLKNTLPNRLYWVLFPIEDLRQAVETAMRILTKEKIDRQLSGQSAASVSFMKVSDSHKSSSNKMAVSFNTIERTDGKIDKVKSLVSQMNEKMDKCDIQFKPQIYQKKEGDRIDVITLKMTTGQEIDCLVETDTHHIEIEEDSVRIINKIIEADHKTILGMTIEETIIENKGIGIEVEVETIADTYRDISRDDYSRDRIFSGDRSRMRQSCSSPRREDRGSSDRSMSRSATRSGSK